MSIIENYQHISSLINSSSKNTKLIVVTKNQDLDKINLIIEQGQKDFGENRVQEAITKWKGLLLDHKDLNLHLIGKLQSNKAKDAFNIFKYIHTLDNKKLSKIFSDLEKSSGCKIKYFVQVNVGDEIQKNGIDVSEVKEFVRYCIFELKLDIIGLMCIPPISGDTNLYFAQLSKLANENNLKELSMGMSNDYVLAIKNGSTFVRVGSGIFSEKSNQS
jgi:pyridoxal phosphate enzyme (YggS family)